MIYQQTSSLSPRSEIEKQFWSKFVTCAPSGIYGNTQVPVCGPAMQSTPFTGAFGINPFGQYGASTVHPDLVEIVKDLTQDRIRDVKNFGLIQDMLDTRSHGRPTDILLSQLVQGQQIPSQVLAQTLAFDRMVDHKGDNLIRRVVLDALYNRRSDDIISNIISGRRHLPRLGETREDWENALLDQALKAKADCVLNVVGGDAALSTPWRTKKHYMGLRELAASGRSKLSGINEFGNPFVDRELMGGYPFAEPMGDVFAKQWVSNALKSTFEPFLGLCPLVPQGSNLVCQPNLASTLGSFPLVSQGTKMVCQPSYQSFGEWTPKTICLESNRPIILQTCACHI